MGLEIWPFYSSSRKIDRLDRESAERYARVVTAGIKNENLPDELFDALRKQHIATAEQIWLLGSRLKVGWVALNNFDQPSPCGSSWTIPKDQAGKYTLKDGVTSSDDYFLQQDVPLLNSFAYFVHKQNLAAVDFLLNKGLDPNQGQDDGRKIFNKRPIYYAFRQEGMLRRLLDGGAMPTDNALKAAIDEQALDSVVILLEYGASKEAGKRFMAAHVNNKKYSKEAFDKLAGMLDLPQASPPETVKKEAPPAAVPAAPKPVVAEPALASSNENKPQEDPDQVVYESAVLDRTMQEVFNFASLERITLIRKSLQGPVESVGRDTFEQLQDSSALQRAFDEHKKRGGKTPEEKVFPNRIPKPAAAARG